MAKDKYKSGILDRDHDCMGRIYLRGTPVKYHRSKDYSDPSEDRFGGDQSKWTGQFRTHYICNDKDGVPGSFTVFYLDLFIVSGKTGKELIK